MVARSSDRRPVVVVVIKGLGIGGAEKLVSEGARYWDRSSFDYRVAFALPWKDQLVAELETLSVPVRCFGSRRGVTPTTVRRLRHLLTEWNADLVHAHLPVAGILSRFASRAPVVYTEHNLAWSYRPATRICNRLTYGRNAAVTAVSAAVAATLEGYPGPSPSVVTNGVSVAVDGGSRARVRNELGLNDDEPLIVHVGNIRPGKGHDLLIDAALSLRDLGVKATIVSIGVEKNPGDLDRLRLRVSEYGLDGRLRFLGRRTDALDFIGAADVYVNPADHEGLPVTILEAMALGRPVVATAVGGVPTVVQNGITGTTIERGRPDLLAAALAKVLDDSSEANRMAATAWDLVATEYGLEPMVRKYEDIYRRVLS